MKQECFQAASIFEKKKFCEFFALCFDKFKTIFRQYIFLTYIHTFQTHKNYCFSFKLTSPQHSNQLLNETVISGTISFSEFSHQFNELVKWLNKMHSISLNTNVSSCCEKYANQVIYSNLPEVWKFSTNNWFILSWYRYFMRKYWNVHQDVNCWSNMHIISSNIIRIWKIMSLSNYTIWTNIGSQWNSPCSASVITTQTSYEVRSIDLQIDLQLSCVQ